MTTVLPLERLVIYWLLGEIIAVYFKGHTQGFLILHLAVRIITNGLWKSNCPCIKYINLILFRWMWLNKTNLCLCGIISCHILETQNEWTHSLFLLSSCLPSIFVYFFKDWFIALKCTNVYMNFSVKLFQILPVYMWLLT